MNSLDQHLSDAATTALAGVGAFIHESQGQATLTANYAALPVIVYGTATTSQQASSSRVEAAAVTVYFADATPGPGDDAAATHATQDRMQQLKRRFLAALDAGPLVQLDGIKATPHEAIYEAMLDGIGCQFTLTVPAGSLLVACLPGAIVVPPVPLAPRITNFVVTGDAPVPLAPLISNLVVTGDTPAQLAPLISNFTAVAA